MRFISGVTAAACAGALLLVPAFAFAQAGGGPAGGGGFGGGGARPGYGANAYAPGQGPTGAAGWYGGNWNGFTNAFGLLGGWGGGYGGGGGAGGGGVAIGGQTNVTTYNHFDNRRRDGGFYGGGGVFYGDDGYSRLYSNKPPGEDSAPVKGSTGYAPGGVYRPSQHIIYLPDNKGRRARNRARHEARF